MEESLLVNRVDMFLSILYPTLTLYALSYFLLIDSLEQNAIATFL